MNAKVGNCCPGFPVVLSSLTHSTHPQSVATTKSLIVSEVIVVSVQESHPSRRSRIGEVCCILLITRQQVIELQKTA